jgi:hypothetical protein
MRRYRLELMLGTVFLAVFLAFYLKVSPGPKLTREAVKPLIVPQGVWPAIGTRTQGIGDPEKTNLAGFYPGLDDWWVGWTWCLR